MNGLPHRMGRSLLSTMLLWAAVSGASAVEVARDALSFATLNQNFQPPAGPSAVEILAAPDCSPGPSIGTGQGGAFLACQATQTIRLGRYEIPGESFGDIRRISLNGINNAAAQQIYDQAMGTCMGRSVTLGFITVSPTAAECRTGKVNRTVLGVPVVASIPGVPSVGLGNRPPSTITKTFDAGYRVVYEVDADARIESVRGLRQVSAGDVTFSGEGIIAASTAAARRGELVTLNTALLNPAGTIGQRHGEAFYDRWDLLVDFNMRATVEVAGPDFSTGDQLRYTHDLLSVSTPGTFRQPLFLIERGADGIEVAAFGGAPVNILPKFEYTFGASLLPIPGGASSLFVDVNRPILELTVGLPDLDLPVQADNPSTLVDEGFKGRLSANHVSGDPVRVVTQLGPDVRPAVGAFVVGGTDQTTDVLRADVDLDGIISVAAGTPLGLRAEIGPPLARLLTLEGNLVDWDFTSTLSYGQTLEFHPNLLVDLQFNQPTLVKTPGGDFVELLSTGPVAVGEVIELLHPGADLVVTPVYSLDQAQLGNQIDWLLSLGFELNLLNLQLGGCCSMALSQPWACRPRCPDFASTFPQPSPRSTSAAPSTKWLA